MIESCSKKRMIIGLSFLGGLTILVLIVESNWASHHSNSSFGKNGTKDPNNCWLHEDFTIVEECHPCTAFEIASESVAVCQDTRFKEIVQCQTSGKIARSCDKVKWLEERHFWIFEGLMFFVGLVSTTAVVLRQKVLDHRMLRRVQRQLASGV